MAPALSEPMPTSSGTDSRSSVIGVVAETANRMQGNSRYITSRLSAVRICSTSVSLKNRGHSAPAATSSASGSMTCTIRSSSCEA